MVRKPTASAGTVSVTGLSDVTSDDREAIRSYFVPKLLRDSAEVHRTS